MSVKEAQLKIDSAEFAEWCAFSNIKPFYIDTTEYMLAVVASILANVHRDKKSRPFSPEDFMPSYDSKKEYDSPEEMELKLRGMFSGHNS